jgi:methionyl-tRNA formyltransferase
MRILFIGQAAFGADALKALIDQGETIAGVITVPDSKGPGVNPLKHLALERNLPLLQTVRLKDPEAVAWVAARQPDLLVLAYVTQFVPKEMIALARFGGINYHPSLLPKYRGGSAMNWAIIRGEKETGVTIHQIDEGVDTGPILLQEKVSIDADETVKTLYFKKLYPLGVRMIAEAVRLIREGKAIPRPQDERLASYQPVIQEEDVWIHWGSGTQQIYNLIRGSNPYPGATTFFRNQKLKIWEARPSSGRGDTGRVIEIRRDEGFAVATGDGALWVERVQWAEGPKTPSADFIRAQGLKSGDRLGE